MSIEQRITAIDAILDADPSPVVESIVDGQKVRVDRNQLLDERDRLKREVARKAGRRPQCATILLNRG